ncbi:MAG TPA: glycosyltransferase family 2 protein [Polyangiaceae bacterium]|jgi:glycosyltransferase involved in cell wall biosynthesis|nr:glycosyltransferase family 2 protein [Polyangiaceae bacterium]HNZ23476.1 glycosyltransferase family 2 protein [Polyangiaceae bacterium]HOD25693.1 glycosyltransferase family 2 protein [Polyangiaceae bacterium]HOE51977.1 glycosyltransferase family 2 protein [Polyangiaceae bacterium]HOH01247.1 glycosyltransferase family 2 protein [Polyangiaceae bacterium]
MDASTSLPCCDPDSASGDSPLPRPKTISVVTPCFNEQDNVYPLFERTRATLEALGPTYQWEHIFIDNASTDGTIEELQKLAAKDRRVKIIINTRNFGVIRSPLHGLFQASGDAIVSLCADLQDPPELITDFVREWEKGFLIVAAVKKGSRESPFMYAVRKLYYRTLNHISETELINDFTGFGLYDQKIIDLVRRTGDHYAFFRGLVADMGFPIARVEYIRPVRQHGLSKNRLYDLYDQAMQGIVKHSKIPLRLTTMTGFIVAFLSALSALGYLIYKIIYWDSFSVGIAPAVIGLFFLSSIQLVFLGMLGEYIGAIHGRLFQNWLVIEKARINFENHTGQEPRLATSLPLESKEPPGRLEEHADLHSHPLVAEAPQKADEEVPRNDMSEEG